MPVTDEARQALPAREDLPITHFPFKVGREGRIAGRAASLLGVVERRLLHAPPLNDVYLLESPSELGFHVSREHFWIDQIGSRFVLHDRKSTCGTWVNDQMVDGHSENPDVELHDGDVITVGRRHSPLRYQFRVSAEEASDSHSRR